MTQPVHVSWKNTLGKTELDTYTGDGTSTSPGRTISLGFQPDIVVIYRLDQHNLAITSNTNNCLHLASSAITEGEETTDVYVDSDGFVVGDGSSQYNTSSRTYVYLAFQQPGEIRISWKDTLVRIEFGQYTGTGGSTAREIGVGFSSDFTFIQQDGSANFWFTLDQTNAAQAAPGLTTTFAETSNVYNSSGGFTVSDGSDTANQTDVTYNYIAIQLTGVVDVSWKGSRLSFERGTHTGDGTSPTGGVNITADFNIDYVFIQEDGQANSFVVSTDTAESIDLSPTLTDNVSTTTGIHNNGSGTGFIVGDDNTDGNANGTVYNWFAIGIN